MRFSRYDKVGYGVIKWAADTPRRLVNGEQIDGLLSFSLLQLLGYLYYAGYSDSIGLGMRGLFVHSSPLNLALLRLSI